jgi:hypothetical protein
VRRLTAWRSVVASVVLPAAFSCRAAPAPKPVVLPPCRLVDKSTLTAEWDPRSLAGQYIVEWITQTDSASHSTRFRILLWPTSMNDSSPRRHTKNRVDTTIAPIYGTTARDSGIFTPKRIEALRAKTDPIYPELLLAAPVFKDPNVAPRFWTVLMMGPQNMRDGGFVTDGTATAMFIQAADANGFRGNFKPGGFGPPDRGYFCAWRVTD